MIQTIGCVQLCGSSLWKAVSCSNIIKLYTSSAWENWLTRHLWDELERRLQARPYTLRSSFTDLCYQMRINTLNTQYVTSRIWIRPSGVISDSALIHNWREASTEVTFKLLGLRKKWGFIFTPIYQPDCNGDLLRRPPFFKCFCTVTVKLRQMMWLRHKRSQMVVKFQRLILFHFQRFFDSHPGSSDRRPREMHRSLE